MGIQRLQPDLGNARAGRRLNLGTPLCHLSVFTQCFPLYPSKLSEVLRGFSITSQPGRSLKAEADCALQKSFLSHLWPEFQTSHWMACGKVRGRAPSMKVCSGNHKQLFDLSGPAEARLIVRPGTAGPK